MQQDGKYVVAGECSDGLGVNVGHVNVCLARFENNGTLDVSFGEGGSTSTWLGKDFSSNQGSVAVQNDGKSVVAGNLLDPVSYRAFVLLRYNTDGSQDTSFGRNGIVIGQVGTWPGSNISGIVIQPDGQIIAAGWVNDGVTAQMMCARYNSDGSLDEILETLVW